MKKSGRPKKWTTIRVCREIILLRRFIESSPLPTLKEFCGQRHYSSQRWSEWVNSSEFSEALKKHIGEAMEMCKERFEVMLIQGGLSGKLDKTMAIFALKNVAGWRDERAGVVVNAQAHAVSSNLSVKDNREQLSEDDTARFNRNIQLLYKYGRIDVNEILKASPPKV